ncbi:MAG: CPBP family intramembrane metalloprotease [Leptolyngbya sp. PLA1]|nr:CPBP family intramembrane metalloprotease [Leptolyngbya sp. PLA1]
MSSGLKPSPAYSGLIHPAEGLFRLTSAMIRVPSLGCLVTAVKKLRGRGMPATLARSSSSGVASRPRAISSRLCATISASTAGVGWWGVGSIAAIVGLAAPCRAQGAAADRASQAAESALDTAQAAGAEAIREAQHTVSSDPWFWGNLLAASFILIVLLGKGLLGPPPARRVADHPTFIWFACAGLIFLVQQISIAMTIASGVSTSPDDLRSLAILGAAGGLSGLAASAVLGRLLAASAPSAGLSFKPRDLPLAIVLGLCVFPLTQCASFAAVALHRLSGGTYNHIAHESLQTILDHRTDPWTWALGLVAVVIAPIVEETLYRGCLQSAFLRLTGRPRASIVFSAAVFTLAHVGVGPWYGLVPIFVLSLGLGLAFERTRSLAVPIGMHVVFNAANVALALAGA